MFYQTVTESISWDDFQSLMARYAAKHQEKQLLDHARSLLEAGEFKKADEVLMQCKQPESVAKYEEIKAQRLARFFNENFAKSEEFIR